MWEFGVTANYSYLLLLQNSGTQSGQLTIVFILLNKTDVRLVSNVPTKLYSYYLLQFSGSVTICRVSLWSLGRTLLRGTLTTALSTLSLSSAQREICTLNS